MRIFKLFLGLLLFYPYISYGQNKKNFFEGFGYSIDTSNTRIKIERIGTFELILTLDYNSQSNTANGNATIFRIPSKNRITYSDSVFKRECMEDVEKSNAKIKSIEKIELQDLWGYQIVADRFIDGDYIKVLEIDLYDGKNYYLMSAVIYNNYNESLEIFKNIFKSIKIFKKK